MKKMVYLRPDKQLDPYHERRLRRHGAIYFVTREHAEGYLYEAKSLATGAVCTLISEYCVEPDEYALQEP